MGTCQQSLLPWGSHLGVHGRRIWSYSVFLHPLSPQAFEAPPPHAYRAGSLKPSGGAGPSPMLPASPYGGPTPASYATASTPAGPAFPVQVKVAQPVRGCGLPRRGAPQASGPPPGPHFPLPGRGEVWGSGYRSHREPGPGLKEDAAGIHGPAGGGRGGGHGPQVSLGWGVGVGHRGLWSSKDTGWRGGWVVLTVLGFRAGDAVQLVDCLRGIEASQGSVHSTT